MADRILDRHYACAQCGETFRPKRTDRLTYCSRPCAITARTIAGREARPPSTPVAFRCCDQCGRSMVVRSGRLVCSQRCLEAKAESARKDRERARYIPRVFSCSECGASCVTEYGKTRARFCSDECGKRAVKRTSRKRERARIRLVRVESVDPLKVFDRDGWRCQCCRKPTPREKRGTYHARAPELDHIIPLAKGGEHSYRNTQLLCRACNGAKSDTDGGQQMRLFG
jgi:hypothetical protein